MAVNFKCYVLLLAGWALASSTLAGPIKDRIRSSSGYIILADTEAVISNLPAPSPGFKAKGSCVASEIEFVDESAKTEGGWILKGYNSQLQLWAIYHYGARAATSRPPQCSDGKFIVQAWQASLKTAITGQLTAPEAKRLVEIVDKYDKRFQLSKSQPKEAPKEHAFRPEVAAMSRAELIAELPQPASRGASHRCGSGWLRTAPEVRIPQAEFSALTFVLVDWSLAHFRFVGDSQKCFDAHVVVTKWQEALGHPVTGLLTNADFERLRAEIDRIAVLVADRKRAHQDAETAQAQERERAEQVRKEREAAAERELQSFLSPKMDPQLIYLRAGKYERSSEPGSATRLYNFLVDTFPNTEWAVKANDRMLQRHTEHRATTRSGASNGANDSTSNQQEDMNRARALHEDLLDDQMLRDEQRRKQEEDRRWHEERTRIENEQMERANEQRRRQVEEWEAEARRSREGQP